MSDPEDQAPATAEANGGRAVAAAGGGVAVGGNVDGGIHITQVILPAMEMMSPVGKSPPPA